MKTYECVARNGNNGNEIVIFVRAYDESSAKSSAWNQAKQQFGSSAGSITIVSCKAV